MISIDKCLPVLIAFLFKKKHF